MYFTDFPQGHSQDFYCMCGGGLSHQCRDQESKASRPRRINRRGAEVRYVPRVGSGCTSPQRGWSLGRGLQLRQWVTSDLRRWLVV